MNFWEVGNEPYLRNDLDEDLNIDPMHKTARLDLHTTTTLHHTVNIIHTLNTADLLGINEFRQWLDWDAQEQPAATRAEIPATRWWWWNCQAPCPERFSRAESLEPPTGWLRHTRRKHNAAMHNAAMHNGRAQGSLQTPGHGRRAFTPPRAHSRGILWGGRRLTRCRASWSFSPAHPPPVPRLRWPMPAP